MSFPLNLVIDRTDKGHFRAEVIGYPDMTVEAADVPGLMDAVQDTLSRFLDPARGDIADDESVRKAALELMPDRETLRRLVARHPVPDRWPEGDEDWDDAP